MSDSEYSSDEEEFDPSLKSEVILGFIDSDIIPSEEEPTIEDTFVGSQPVWLHEESQPDEKLLKCLNCGGGLSLLLQAFAPLPGELYDRVIYVFCCGRKECNKKEGTVRAIRGVSKDPVKLKQLRDEEEREAKEKLEEKLKLDNSRNFLFGADDKKDASDSNPFGTASSNPFGGNGSSPFGGNDSDSNPFGNPFASTEKKEEKEDSFASIAAKSAPPKKSTSHSGTKGKKLPEFPGYFLYTDDEKFKKIDNNKLPEGVRIDDSAFDLEKEISSSSAGGNNQVNAEYSRIAKSLTDEDFEKFTDVLSHNPAQVLRYSLDGTPLLYSTSDPIGVKAIKKLVPIPGFNPSSSRRFELQVMSKLLIDVEKGLKNIEDGMEWVTILVYTDAEDYVGELDEHYVGYVEEWCGVQWETAPK